MDIHDLINAELALLDSIPHTTTIEAWHQEAQRLILRLAERLEANADDEDIEALICLTLVISQIGLRPIVRDAAANVETIEIIGRMQKSASDPEAPS